MMPILALLLHDDGMDIIYFWSSIFMVALPLIVFGGLTYFVVKASRKQPR
jgi:heme/copper-type cytochrome/quinol oxidase subunit 2